jgi:hypothetical protein
MYCKILNMWPYQSKCDLYLETGDECTSDYECKITDYCWYPDAASVISDAANKTLLKSYKKCMKKFSKADGTTFGWKQEKSKISIQDYMKNGLYCESGLAYNSANNTAKCTSTTQLTWDNKPTVYPYTCDPTVLSQ